MMTGAYSVLLPLPSPGKFAGWQVMVKYLTHKWRLMLGCNLKALAAGKPVLPVFFEEVKKDPAPQLERMMEFLELPVSPAVVNATVMVSSTACCQIPACNYCGFVWIVCSGWVHFLLPQPHRQL